MRVVNVDVVVLDRDGNPVTGLTQDDFRLWSDGKEVDVDYFQPYVASADRSVAPPEASPSTERGDPRTVLLYIDELATRPPDRKRVVKDLTDYLHGLVEREARFRLVLRRQDLQVVELDPSDPLRHLDRLLNTRASARSMEPVIGDRRARDEMASIYNGCVQSSAGEDPCICAFPQMMARSRSFASEEEDRLQRSLGDLTRLVSALSGVAGQKVLIFIGGALPQQPGLHMFHHALDFCPAYRNQMMGDSLEWDRSRDLQRVAAHANVNRVSLVTLDPWAGYFSREFGETAEVQRSNYENTLFFLADETGGKAILNNNRPSTSVETTVSQQLSSYSLGFTLSDAPTGEVHALRVELEQPTRGVRLRYRKAFVDKPIPARLVDRLSSILVMGGEQNPLGIEVGFDASSPPESRPNRNDHRVPLVLSIPRDRLTMISSINQGRAQLRLMLSSTDGRGHSIGVLEKQINVLPGDGNDTTQPAVVVVRLALPQGRHEIAIGVRDEIGQTASWLRRSVTVPVSSATGPATELAGD